MTKSFTQNDLVRYIYQEMTAAESEQFVQLLHINPQMMQEYLEVLETIEQLDSLLMEPSEKISTEIKNMAQSAKGLEKV
jgi:hypothetical protein